MKALIDLQHPAHLHFFKNLADRLENEGHQVLFTGRDKDILIDLADGYGREIQFFGVARKGVANLGRELFYRQWRLQSIIREFKPDVIMAIAGTFVSLVGKIMRVPTYIFYDTEHATVSNLLAYPFATCIYVPKCYRKKIYWRHQRYNGYHELAYLHPKYFAPDPRIHDEAGLKEKEIFSIIRFVGWGAGHDIGLSGFTNTNKLRAVKELENYGRVLISCEGEMPAELEPYRLRLNLTKIHDLMAYASLIFGESATMCSEGAVLGVPGIYVDPVGRGYTDEQEKDYGIIFNFTSADQEQAIQKGVSILKDNNRAHWKACGKRIVEEKIDVTEMLYQIASERP